MTLMPFSCDLRAAPGRASDTKSVAYPASWIPALELLHDAHRHLGEVVESEVVQGAFADESDRAEDRITPETLPVGDENRFTHARSLAAGLRGNSLSEVSRPRQTRGVKPSRERYLMGLLVLAGLFVAALVSCNLIATKFTEIDLGFHVFVVSVGILPYPLTFLITDILSEVYGKRRANQVVLVGFLASMMVIGIIHLALAVPATTFGATDAAFDDVFGKAWRLITGSMVAYLAAQLVDVQMFHFWKRVTRGKHLWLRNTLRRSVLSSSTRQ